MGRRRAPPGDPRAVDWCDRVDPGPAVRRDVAAHHSTRVRAHRPRLVVGGVPFSMYSTATQAVARQLHFPGLSTVSLVVFWTGFGLWMLIAAGLVHAAGIAVSGSPRQR